MKKDTEYDKIDLKFIGALDKIIERNTSLGVKPSNDSSIGKLIYPTNRSIISSVRSRSKHIPHMALINFAKVFNVDMNYFYHSECEFKFIGGHTEKINENIKISGNHVSNVGDNNPTVQAGKGSIKGINRAEKGSNNIILAIDTVVNNFSMSDLDRGCLAKFYDILAAVQSDYRSNLEMVEKIVIEKNQEIVSIRKEYGDQIAELNQYLREANIRAFEAQKNENQALKRYLKAIG